MLLVEDKWEPTGSLLGYLFKRAQEQGGTTSILQEGMNAAGESDGMALLMAFVPLLTPALTAAGVPISKLTQPYATSDTTSSRLVKSRVEMMNAALPHLSTEVGASAKASVAGLTKALSGLISKLSPGTPANIVQDQIQSTLAGMPDAQLGQILQTTSAIFPAVGDALRKLDPGLITDYTPLLVATQQRNAGEFNAADFEAQRKAVQDMRGHARALGIDGQTLMDSYPHIQQMVGLDASPARIFGTLRLANTLVQNGGARTFDDALKILPSIGDVGKMSANPDAAEKQVIQAVNVNNSVGGDASTMAAAAQMSREQGTSLNTALQSRALASRITRYRQDNELSANDSGDQAAQTMFQNIGKSDTTRALAVALKSPYRDRVLAGLQSEDPKQVESMMHWVAKQTRNPAFQQHMSRIDTGEATKVMSAPGVTNELVRSDLSRFVQTQGTPALRQMFRTPGAMAKALKNPNILRMDPQTAAQLEQIAPFVASTKVKDRVAPVTQTPAPLPRAWAVTGGPDEKPVQPVSNKKQELQPVAASTTTPATTVPKTAPSTAYQPTPKEEATLGQVAMAGNAAANASKLKPRSVV